MNARIEPRTPDDAQSRALVMDWAAVRWIIGILGTIGFTLLSIGIYVGTTVANHSVRIATLEAEMKVADAEIRPMGLTLREVSTGMDIVTGQLSKLDDQLDRLTSVILNGRDKP